MDWRGQVFCTVRVVLRFDATLHFLTDSSYFFCPAYSIGILYFSSIVRGMREHTRMGEIFGIFDKSTQKGKSSKKCAICAAVQQEVSVVVGKKVSDKIISRKICIENLLTYIILVLISLLTIVFDL